MKLEVYGRSTPYCAYCVQAKNDLDSRGIEYTFIDLTHEPEKINKLRELGLSSVPQLFLNGVHVGDSKAAKTVTLTKKVKKRTGEIVDFDAEKVNLMAEWAKNGSTANWSSIVMKAMHKLPEVDITTEQIQSALIQSALSFEDPEYNKVAGRLLLGDLRKSTLAPESFVDFYHQMVEDGYWADMGFNDTELEMLDSKIDHDRDLSYGYPTIRQYIDKYAKKDENGCILERIQFTYMGVAMSLFKHDSLWDIIDYYNKASLQKINIPSPVLSTQRTTSNAGVSCVITTAGDTLQGIESTKHIISVATAHSAGLGVEYNVRSPKDDVRKGYAKAGGKLPHYRVAEMLVKELKQANRGGSATVSFNVLDPEIESLLALKLPRTIDERRIEQLDYSFVFNNDFLRRASKKQDWCLVSQRVFPELYDAFYNNRSNFSNLMDYALANNLGKKISAFEILTQYISARLETGRMYTFNIDNVNDHTPFNETIRLSNLCQEIALPTKPYNHIMELYKDTYSEGDGVTAQCFLSAIDVARIDSDEDYYNTAYITLKSLDNLIDCMDYPFPQFKDTAQKYRSVGVGINNLAYKLAKDGTGYSDKQALHDIAERHYYYLLKASVQLAKERGAFEFINKTKWKDGWLPIDSYNKNIDKIIPNNLKYDWESLRKDIIKYGVRFSVIVAHMPCESSSLFSNSTNGLYPIRYRVTYKDSKTGKVQFFPPEVDNLNYEYAWDTPPREWMNACGIIQKFSDQTISMDTWLDYSKHPNGKVSISSLIKDYLYGNSIGIKTLYYQNFKTSRGESNIEPESDCENCSL